MHRLGSFAAVIAVLAGFGLAPAPAAAQVDSKCLAKQLQASGTYAAAREKCEARAAAKGEAVDAACVAKALEKATKALANAEKKDDCLETGRTELVDDVVEDFVAEISRILNPPPVICCQLAAPACLYTEDAAACAAAPLNGTPGAAGSVCSGDGTCSAPPASAGQCCEGATAGGVLIPCLHGGTFDEASCGTAGGTYSASAICTPSGLCE